MTDYKPRRLLIVEDDHLTSALLDEVLSANGFDVRQAASARAAREALDEFDPDVVLMDIMLGDGPSGVALGHLIVREYPGVAVIFLTRYPTVEAAGLSNQHIPAGCGFLRKDRIADVGYLLEAVEGTLRDRPENYRQDTSDDSRLSRLTPNQLAVLRMTAQGLTNAAIARRRGSSESAVEQVLASVFRNLCLSHGGEVSPRMQSVRIYIAAAGLPEDP